MAKALTAMAVERAKAGKNRREIPDGGLQGLYLVVQPSGAKSWAVRYRVGSRTRKLTLQTSPMLSLAEAREHASAALRAITEGRDPGQEKSARRQTVNVAKTIDELAERFLSRYVLVKTKPSSARETARILGFKIDTTGKLDLSGKGVIAKWRGRPIVGIRRGDAIELIESIVDEGSPISANRTLAVLRKMFNWAIECDIVEKSPFAGVKPPGAETERDRVLSDAEINAVWQAAETVGWPFGPAVRLMLLTGQRRDEVAEMTWAEINFAAWTWTLARSRTKNNKPHVVSLSAPAVAILETLPHIASTEGYVFTTTGTSPIKGFSRAKQRFDTAVAKILETTPEGWTFHDLRRTCATGMERLQINLPVIEAVLNHKSGTKRGVAGIYPRHEYADESRAALEAWGRYIGQLVSESDADDVVPMCRRPPPDVHVQSIFQQK
jgi:integrase